MIGPAEQARERERWAVCFIGGWFDAYMYGLCRLCELRSLAISFGSVLHVRLMDLIKVCGFAQANTCVHIRAMYSDIVYVVAASVDVSLVVCVYSGMLFVFTHLAVHISL